MTLSSKHTLRVEGLATLPNFSFMAKKALDPSFVFQNNLNPLTSVSTGKRIKASAPVTYIACVQTDSLGLGDWLSPSRGTIPYAWETPLNYYIIAPVMLEYYYGSTTPNDLMIAAISGPGYLYPKPIDPADLVTLLQISHQLSDSLDINIMETMDDSEGTSTYGNNDLTEEVADAYFNEFSEFVGFLNGYGPAFTFAHTNGTANNGAGQSLLSFDYYLSEKIPDAEAADDIMELSYLNTQMDGPYFLLIHVREYSDVGRVANVLAMLPDGFEVLPLDQFLAYAASSPSFEEHYAPY